MSLTPKKSPMQMVQAKGDALKKEVDNLEKNVKDLMKAGNNSKGLNDAYQSCINLKLQSSDLLVEAHSLLQVNEKTKYQNFQTKKNEEVERVQKLQYRLNTLMDEVESSSLEVEHLRSLRRDLDNIPDGSHNTPTHSEVQDDDDDDEEDSEDEEENELDESLPNFYEAICKFEAQEPGDLTIEEGAVVSVIHRENDGWWKVRDVQDNIGMVPSNFLKEYEEDEEDEEENEEESALNEDTDTPVGPSQDSQDAAENSPSKRSGKELWKGLKDQFNEPAKTDVTDVLAALGAIPAGFRPSTLERFSSREEYTLKNAVLPALTESGLGFLDLQWDYTLNQVRDLPTRILRNCKILSCKMIPMPGTGVSVLSRHVRMALFNGSEILSNIHTVRATWVENSPKMWTFSPRVPDILPSLYDGACVIRSDLTHSNLGILFELCITYIRSKTGERGESSCGWDFLKLFDEQGAPIANKVYELALNGGTPFERGVAVDPLIARRASTSRLRNLLSLNKRPKLVIKMGAPNNTRRKTLNLLPANILLPATYCEHVAYHRRFLADALIRDRLSERDAKNIPNLVLSTFHDAIMLPDIMDALRSAWENRLKKFKRGDLRDKEGMKSKYRKVFLETAYVLMRSFPMPAYSWANAQVEKQRWQKIYAHLQLSQSVPSSGVKVDQTNAVLKMLLSSNVEHLPFDMQETTFNLIRHHKKPIPSTTCCKNLKPS